MDSELLKKELSSYAKIAEKEIGRYLNRKPDYLYEPLRDLISRGGKRIRPGLCMISCEAVGEEKQKALKIASFIEMVHNFTLIHDDIADRSELRRGDPCLHHKYGLGSAVNAGDGLFSVSYEALGDAIDDFDEKKSKRLIKTLSGYITRVCEGQAMDIGWAEQGEWELDEKDYFDMIQRKTGALMAASCEAGGIIGDASDKEIKALREFGMDMGIGFQIHDDVLNLRADVEKYGKEIGGDVNEGKRSLIVIYTLSVCTPEEKKRLIKILDKERNSKEEIKEAIGLFNKYGSIDRAAEVALEKIEKGKKGLEVLPDSKAKDLLISIANYMIEREL
jgi:geranylgeranyl diphosphate synthase type I